MASDRVSNTPLRHRISTRQLSRTSDLEALPLIAATNTTSFGHDEASVETRAHLERQAALAKLEEADSHPTIIDGGYVSPNLMRRVLGTKLSTIKEQLSLPTLKSDTGQKRKLKLFSSRKRHTVSGMTATRFSDARNDAVDHKSTSTRTFLTKDEDACWPSQTLILGAPDLAGSPGSALIGKQLPSHHDVLKPRRVTDILPKAMKEPGAGEAGFIKLFQGFLLRQLEGPPDDVGYEFSLEHISPGADAVISGTKAQRAMRHASGNAIPVSPARLAASTSVRSATLPRSLMRSISLRSARFSWSEEPNRHNVETETIRTGEMISSFPVPPMHTMPRLSLVNSSKQNRKSMWSAFPEPIDDVPETTSTRHTKAIHSESEDVDTVQPDAASQHGRRDTLNDWRYAQGLLVENHAPAERSKKKGRDFMRSNSHRSMNDPATLNVERRPCSRQLARARSGATHITSLIQTRPGSQSAQSGILNGTSPTNDLDPADPGD